MSLFTWNTRLIDASLALNGLPDEDFLRDIRSICTPWELAYLLAHALGQKISLSQCHDAAAQVRSATDHDPETLWLLGLGYLNCFLGQGAEWYCPQRTAAEAFPADLIELLATGPHPDGRITGLKGIRFSCLDVTTRIEYLVKGLIDDVEGVIYQSLNLLSDSERYRDHDRLARADNTPRLLTALASLRTHEDAYIHDAATYHHEVLMEAIRRAL